MEKMKHGKTEVQEEITQMVLLPSSLSRDEMIGYYHS